MKKVINVVLILICVGCLIGWTYLNVNDVEKVVYVEKVSVKSEKNDILKLRKIQTFRLLYLVPSMISS